MSNQNDTDIQRLAAAAKTWAESSEGSSALNDLADKVVSIGEDIARANQIDQLSLRKPVTF